MDTADISLLKIETKIYLIRGKKVMLDTDLAGLYGVETKNLNKAAGRNIQRFPTDFMFQLTKNENELLLKFQTGTSSYRHGGRRTNPYAFTQEGIAMLSGVLQSDRAIQVNIAIMRVFVQMRGLLISNKEFAAKLNELEAKYDRHDGELKLIFDAIRKLMSIQAIPHKSITGLGKKDV
jgi:phage regulator Rha-like protein